MSAPGIVGAVSGECAGSEAVGLSQVAIEIGCAALLAVGHEGEVGDVADADPREFAAIVTPGSSLRTALDIIVTSRTHIAVVVDDENRYQGIVTLDRLTAELRP